MIRALGPVVLCLSLAGPGFAQITSPPPPPLPPLGPVFMPGSQPATGSSSLSGRVLQGDTGAPLGQAVVDIRSAELRTTRTVLADSEGRFEFRNLPAGQYTITATRDGFVPSTYGQATPSDVSRTFALGEGHQASNLDIRVHRGGVITGRVTDEFGQPAANVRVSAVRPQYMQGQRRLLPVGSPTIVTNDLGEYRLFGLPAGRFYVSAVPPRRGTNLESADRLVPVAIYHPNATRIEDTKPVAVELGRATSGIDFVLRRVPAAPVAGVARRADGTPLANASVMLQARGDEAMTGFVQPTQTMPDGTFRFSAVPRGEYVLRSEPRPQPGTAPVGQPMTANPDRGFALITVDSSDVANVVVEPPLMMTVTGRVVADGPMPQVSGMRIMVRYLGGPAMSGMLPSAPIEGDRFTLQVPVTPERVVLTLTGPPGFLGSVLVNGVETIDTGFELRPDVRDIEVRLTTRLTTVTGFVQDAAGAPAPETMVVAFAVDPARWLSPSGRHVIIGRADRSGRYFLRGAPPGEYYIAPMGWNMQQPFSADPELLESLRGSAQRITIREGTNPTFDVRLPR